MQPTIGAVLAILVMLLLGVPVLELFAIIKMSGYIGWAQTLGLMVGVSVAGAFLVHRSGLGVLRQMKERLAQGELPARELVDGVLILVAGAFMLTPGFLTDVVGLLLLLPPTRIGVRTLLINRFRSKVQIFGWHPPGRGFGDVYDANEVPDDRP